WAASPSGTSQSASCPTSCASIRSSTGRSTSQWTSRWRVAGGSRDGGNGQWGEGPHPLAPSPASAGVGLGGGHALRAPARRPGAGLQGCQVGRELRDLLRGEAAGEVLELVGVGVEVVELALAGDVLDVDVVVGAHPLEGRLGPRGLGSGFLLVDIH